MRVTSRTPTRPPSRGDGRTRPVGARHPVGARGTNDTARTDTPPPVPTDPSVGLDGVALAGGRSDVGLGGHSSFNGVSIGLG